jgi:hypothetical protein
MGGSVGEATGAVVPFMTVGTNVGTNVGKNVGKNVGTYVSLPSRLIPFVTAERLLSMALFPNAVNAPGRVRTTASTIDDTTIDPMATLLKVDMRFEGVCGGVSSADPEGS